MSAIAPFITRLYVLNFEAGMPKSKNYAPRPGGGIGASLSHRRQSLLSFPLDTWVVLLRTVSFQTQLGNDFLEALYFRSAKRFLADTSSPTIIPAGHDQPCWGIVALAQGIYYLQECWSGRHSSERPVLSRLSTRQLGRSVVALLVISQPLLSASLVFTQRRVSRLICPSFRYF